ncbi:MAG: DNA polymerase I [bacterium]|jgi:DNA polymerase I|nr:DNA polymerase I [bacterium]
MKNQDTFLALDGNALLHRAWHAIPPLTTKEGLVVNAAYGFAMIVEKMLEQFNPTYMAVAWDLPGGTFRNEIYPEYKAGREEKGQELYDQIPMIQEILEAFGIPSIDAEGFEADDILGTLSAKAGEKGMKMLIVTGDLDALQLVNDQSHVVFFVKGVSQTKIYDVAAVEERYGLTPDQLIDYKSLRGDTSDNIPGLKGVGDKTASLLLQRYDTVEGIYKAIEAGEVEEKYAKKFRGKEEEVETSKVLVTIVEDVPLKGFRFPAAKVAEPNWNEVLRIYRKLEFRTLLRKHKVPMADVPAPKKVSKKKGVDVVVVKNVDDLKGFVESKELGILIAEQPADLFGSTRAAVALSDGKATAVLMNPRDEDMKELVRLAQSANTLITHDVKHLMHQLGERLSGTLFDTMIGSYLLHAGSRAHDLPTVATNMLGAAIPELPETYTKEKDYKRLGEASAALISIAKNMRKELKSTGGKEIFEDMEMPLAPVLYQMETEGIKLDVDGLVTFSKSLEKKINKLTTSILKHAGTEFNINSPSQLAVVLFETLELPTKGIKKTKKGFSTAASELEKLWDKHEIVPLIREYRELTKLQSTYVDALPKLVAKDGRIHSSFNQTVAATGRLSSSDPNLQNIPIKTELGREIRKAFVAPKGKVLIAADYSQIELRLAAIIAKDKPFIKAFNEGADIHTRTAAQMWEVNEADVTKEQRRAAKAINFGILYGMGPRALSKSAGVSFGEAKEFIDRYFEIHQSIREYMETTKQQAHEDGYVETLFGRRRYLPEIQSGIPMLVASAERMAINMPMQGTQADIVKKAMLSVDGWLKTSGWPAKMLLQVHDELVLEVDKDAALAVAKGLKEIMETIAEFEVPLAVDVEIGPNWGEMKSAF